MGNIALRIITSQLLWEDALKQYQSSIADELERNLQKSLETQKQTLEAEQKVHAAEKDRSLYDSASNVASYVVPLVSIGGGMWCLSTGVGASAGYALVVGGVSSLVNKLDESTGMLHFIAEQLTSTDEGASKVADVAKFTLSGISFASVIGCAVAAPTAVTQAVSVISGGIGMVSETIGGYTNYKVLSAQADSKQLEGKLKQENGKVQGTASRLSALTKNEEMNFNIIAEAVSAYLRAHKH